MASVQPDHLAEHEAGLAAVEVDHVVICWTGDRAFETFPDTADSDRLAARLVWLVELLHQRPELIRHVAGACP